MEKAGKRGDARQGKKQVNKYGEESCKKGDGVWIGTHRWGGKCRDNIKELSFNGDELGILLGKLMQKNAEGDIILQTPQLGRNKMEQGYLSRLAQDIQPYTPGEQPRAGEKLIKLNTNENPYPPADAVWKAIRDAADGNLRLYPDPESTDLCRSIAQANGLRAENVFVGNGSDEVLALSFPAFFDPDRTIRFCDITYSFYRVYAGLYQIPYETIPLREDFSVDIEAFEKPAGGVLIPNPNAPTGRILTLEEIERILLAQKGCVVIIDEAYIQFGGQSCAGLISKYKNLLVVRTFSKSHSLAGLRVGYALGDAGLIDGLCRIKNSFNSYPLDRIAQAGAKAAIESKAYYDACAQRIIQTRTWFVQKAEQLGCMVVPSMANFVFVKPPVPAETVQSRLRDHGILVRHFQDARIRDYLRITIGTRQEMESLVSALERIFDEAGGSRP